jgi:hypothetical protein
MSITENDMKAKLRKKCGSCPVASIVAGCLFDCTKTERVLRELDLAMRTEASQSDPIMEQIKQCPEAFQAGELVGKLFDSLNHPNPDSVGDERYLAPPGTVLPPLV